MALSCQKVKKMKEMKQYSGWKSSVLRHRIQSLEKAQRRCDYGVEEGRLKGFKFGKEIAELELELFSLEEANIKAKEKVERSMSQKLENGENQ